VGACHDGNHQRAFCAPVPHRFVQFIRRTPEISVGPVRVLKFGEFVRNLHVPTNLNIIQAHPLRGNGLFISNQSGLPGG